ncbi:MAG: GTP-binding protein [Chloroflexaceae bacterium]
MITPSLTIITGFLGSGKTTLLRALLERGAGGRRLGLVVNELGQIGLDGGVLEQAGAAPLVELTGGCVCCEAGSDFLLAVEELSDYAPDCIVVETTGLAEPGGIIRRARSAGLPLDAVVAVADAANLEAALAVSPVAEWQLRAADLIVLSKVDLVAPAEHAAVSDRLRALNPRAAIVPARYGQVAPELLFGPRLDQADPSPRPDHLEQDAFSSLSWSSNTPLRRAALEEALRDAGPTVFRAKGIVHCTDAPWPDEVQFVCGRLSFTPLRPRAPLNPLNRLVLLGPRLAARAGHCAAALDACADDPARAAAWQARYAALFD